MKDGHIFISAGYNKGASLLRLGAGEPAKVWENKEMRNQMNPSVLIDGYLYGIDGNNGGEASLKCLDWKTGAAKWSEKSVGSGSVTMAGGKLIVLSERGELMVARPDPGGFKPESKAKVLNGRCWTVPGSTGCARARVTVSNGRRRTAIPGVATPSGLPGAARAKSAQTWPCRSTGG